MKLFSERLIRLPSLFLAAALQLLPILRTALPAAEGAGSVVMILFRWAPGLAAALGGIQAVSGASTVITNPLTRNATNGQPFSLRLTTAPDQAHYWTASGLPAGITLSGTSGSSFWLLTGAPSVAGVFSVGLTAKDQITSGASRTCTATLMLTVIDLTPPATPPSVTAQPGHSTLTAGQSAVFTVGVRGSAPLAYQWRWNGSDLASGTNATLRLSNVTSVDAGSYDVVVTNSFGTATSNPATLTVNSPPQISAQPQNVVGLAGQNASFSVTASGTPTLYYFWRRSTTTIASGTNSTLTLTNTQLGQAGNYSVVVSNLAGTLLSSTATLTVNQAPAISTPPSSVSLSVGQSASLLVSATGTAPLRYQWLLGGVPLAAKTNSNLALSSVTTNDAGSYQVVVTNAFGVVTSAVAVVTVNVPPAISTPPQDVTVPAGQDAQFSVTASGTAPLVYFWRKGSSVVAVSTNSSLTVTNAQLTQAGGYTVTVSNLAGVITSPAALLTVNQGPLLISQPTNRTVIAGQATVFTVGATGWPSPAFQWFRDGLGLPGATNASFTLFRVMPADAAGYSVVVTNAFGMATSLVATLTVTQPPDHVRPTLKISVPSATSTLVNSNAFLLSGTAGDDYGLSAVRVFLVGGGSVTAAGTSNWTALVTLAPGTNVFQVASFDLADNASATNSRTLVYMVTSPITLGTQGLGAISGAVDGQPLQVGRGYALSAIAGAGSVFSNWTGGLSSTANPLWFLMTSNLSLTANFVPNPFPGAAGNYAGLYFTPTNLQPGAAGSVSVTVRPNGQFTAKLINGKAKQSFSGQFDLEGWSTNRVARKGTNELVVGLSLDLHGAGVLAGSVGDGAWTSDLLAHRAGFQAKTNPATALARLYTLIVPGASNDTLAPAGDGFGAIKVDLGGVSAVGGSLADGTKLAQKVAIGSAGEWGLYVPCDKGAGALLGWLSIQPTNTPAILGTLHWLHPAGAVGSWYPNGFVLDCLAAGSGYTPPGTNRLLQLPKADFIFFGGNQGGPFTNTVALGPGGKYTNLGPLGFTLSVQTAKGTFTGSVVLPGSVKARKFQGAILQSLDQGGGYFLGTNRIGNVTAQP